ncbi:MAG: sugar phosphate isomerase/epimerase family protein [Runella sp.]
MFWGISSFTYGWKVGDALSPMTEMDLVEQTLAFGFDTLQIGDNLPLHLMSPQRIENLKVLVQQHSLRLEIGARGLTSEHLERYIQLAHNLNAPLIRFVTDTPDYEPTQGQVIGILREVIPLLDRHQLTLGIENHDRFTARQLAQIIEQVEHERVGICLDCANSLGANEGLEWVTQILAPYTVNLHIKDFTIRRLPHLMGFVVEGRPAGQGMLRLEWLLEQLLPYRRCQSAILELWTVPETDPILTRQKEEEWAIQSVNYLKTIIA